MSRSASIERNTSETKIKLSIDLDGNGNGNIHTAVSYTHLDVYKRQVQSG